MIKIVVLFAFLLSIIFIYRYLFRKKQQSVLGASDDDYTPIVGSKSKNEFKNMSMQDKIELSWRFLYEITEIVLNRFSKEDVAVLNQIGNSLINSGMKYEHVVELSLISYSASHTKSVEQQSQSQNAVAV